MPNMEETTLTPEDCAAMGMYLFPCRGKRPLVKSWLSESTRDLPTIRRWAKQYPGCWWATDCGKTGVVVVDDDRGKNPAAIDSMFSLELEHGPLPDTFSVATPNAGFHYYLKGEGRNSASSRLGKGIDTRGVGGYVMAPCSPGYRVVNRAGIADAPAWLIERIGKPAERDPQVVPDNLILDAPFSVKRAVEYLTNCGPAIEGDGGDLWTYKVACRVRDLGISQDKCLDLMLEHWNDYCQPPWDEDALGEKVFNAYRYAEKPAGTEAPEAVFEAVAEEALVVHTVPGASTTDARPMFIDAHDLIKRELTIKYVVNELIETPTTGLIFGDPGAGKSFLAIDMALSVAHGAPWMGADTTQGPWLYFAGEGHAGLQRRIMAWLKHYGHEDIAPGLFTLSQRRLELTEKSVMKLEPAIRAMVNKYGPLAGITVDTLARHLAGAADENSAKDISGFINAVDYLRDRFECVAAVVHHSGKMNKESSRGSSAIKGALDWEFKVAEGEVRFTKQKEGELPRPIGFRIEQVELGPEIRSAIPIKCDYDPTHGKSANLGDDQLLALNLLQFGISANRVTFLSKKDLRSEFCDALGPSVKPDTKRRKFSRAMEELAASGTIRVEKGNIYDNTLSRVDNDD